MSNVVLFLALVLAFAWGEKQRAEELLPVTSGDVAAQRATLRLLEERRLRELQLELRDKNIHVQGFYHIATVMPHWLEVYQEQLRLLEGKHRDLHYDEGVKHMGLIDLTEKLNVYEVKIRDMPSVHPELSPAAVLRETVGFADKVEHKSFSSIDRNQYRLYLKHNRTDELLQEHLKTGITLGEYPTITALHQHCRREVAAGRQSLVFYMHLKSGGSMILPTTVANKETAPAFWREAMGALNIEYSSICLRALLNGSSVCGSLYRHLPTSHYAGNFFWASCNHIAQLAPLPSPVTDFEASEFFLMRTHDQPEKTADFAIKCAFNVLTMNRRYYRKPILPAEYIQKLQILLETRELPVCGISRQEKPFLCRGDMQYKGRPCLSAQTAPDPTLKNYYGVSFSDIQTFRWE